MHESFADLAAEPCRGRCLSRLLPFGTALLLSVTACDSTPDYRGLIDREDFIGTYVELRAAALRNSGELAEDQRERILSEHGVTGTDLTAFVEGHGPELEFMRDLWNEIETRIDSLPTTVEAPAP
jgi:hypothetical protein